MSLSYMNELKQYIFNLFNVPGEIPNEVGFRLCPDREITRLGFCTNLTPQSIDAAAQAKADLLVTHHDAWDFMYGMKQVCHEKLDRYGILHLFVHAPLDAADFGTSATLVQRLGASVTGKSALMEGYYCGRIGEFPAELDFEELVKRMEETCEEPVTFWNKRKTQVRKIAVTTGGGSLTDLVREAADLGCDTYITGERNLYLAEYAEFLGINLITGSHTFTEIQGVESLARLIGEKFGIETVRIQEPHLETRRD